MELLISLIFAAGLARLGGKHMQMLNWPLYGAGAVFAFTACLAYLLTLQDKVLKTGAGVGHILAVCDNGTLGTAFFIVVMFGAVLPRHWDLRKNIMRARGELSILGGVVLLPHLFHYVIDTLLHLDRFKAMEGMAFWTFTMMVLLGLYAGAIFIPLWVTSFPRVRKKLKGKRWKNIQRHAYLFYAFVYLHVMLAYALHPEPTYAFASCLYTLLFAAYLTLRFQKRTREVVRLVVMALKTKGGIHDRS
ncbi:hypothetical protein ACKQTC_08415 [Peptococcus simiae]|uniref:DMSO/TMAO reductase YedYZ, heme-binding membrane subunit n=1 Tax=Peptococcus simiae TaxID=1643805 RepID=A0ABW9H3G7_9FIRM